MRKWVACSSDCKIVRYVQQGSWVSCFCKPRRRLSSRASINSWATAADGGGVGLAGVRFLMLAVKNSRTRWAVAESERTGRGAGSRRPGEFPVLGLWSWNQCRVVGHEGLLIYE